MEIKIKEQKLGPAAPLPDPPPLVSAIRPQSTGACDSLSSVAHFGCPLRNQLDAPVEMRWTEENLNRIFINFINTSTKQKQDSFIDLNIKITCAFFAFSQR